MLCLLKWYWPYLLVNGEPWNTRKKEECLIISDLFYEFHYDNQADNPIVGSKPERRQGMTLSKWKS